MPRSKSVNTYPQAYWEICERVATKKEVFEVEVPTIQKALSMQGQFYAFRGALRREYDSQIIRNKDPEWTDKLNAYIEFSAKTVCWVSKPDNSIASLGRPIKVQYVHRDNTPGSDILNKALLSGKSQEQVADEAEASLQAMLNKIDPKFLPKKDSNEP